MAIHEQKGRRKPFFVFWTNPFTGKRESKSCATREDAEKLDAYIKYQLKYERDIFRRDENAPLEGTTDTLETLLYAYLKDRKLTLPNLEKTLTALRQILIWYGDEEMSSISTIMLTQMKERLFSLGNKGTTIRRKMGIVKAALAWGHRQGYIDNIPCFPIIQSSEYAQYMPPTQAEIARIYSVAPEHLQRVIVLGFQFGIRVGQSELLKLRWHDVDFLNHVIRAPNANKGAKEAYREIPIKEALMPLFLDWYESDNEHGIIYIINYKGKPVKSIKTAWKSALYRANINRYIRPYDLRHGFATEAIAAGIDYGTVAALMGHSSPVMVLKHYQHIRDYGAAG